MIDSWWKRAWGLQEASTPGNDVSLISAFLGHLRLHPRLFLLSEDSFYSIGVDFGDGTMDGEAIIVDGFEESLRTLEIC